MMHNTPPVVVGRGPLPLTVGTMGERWLIVLAIVVAVGFVSVASFGVLWRKERAPRSRTILGSFGFACLTVPFGLSMRIVPRDNRLMWIVWLLAAWAAVWILVEGYLRGVRIVSERVARRSLTGQAPEGNSSQS